MERLMANPMPLPWGFGGKERRKDLIDLLHRQAYARVTDRELELTVMELRRNRKLSA
jgi:hypothetical protein